MAMARTCELTFMVETSEADREPGEGGGGATAAAAAPAGACAITTPHLVLTPATISEDIFAPIEEKDETVGAAGDAITAGGGATDSSHQRRRCHGHGCHKWWQSSAGGKSGVFSVVLAVIIVVYAAFIMVSTYVADLITDHNGGAEVYLKITTPNVVVVNSICGLLILLTVWTIRRVTCARRSTLADIAKTAEARRESKWFVVRILELVHEMKGPGSPYFYQYLLAKEVIETGLQVLNVAGYADRGYSPAGTYCVLCTVYCVLCTVYCVLCSSTCINGVASALQRTGRPLPSRRHASPLCSSRTRAACCRLAEQRISVVRVRRASHWSRTVVQ